MVLVVVSVALILAIVLNKSVQACHSAVKVAMAVKEQDKCINESLQLYEVNT